MQQSLTLRRGQVRGVVVDTSLEDGEMSALFREVHVELRNGQLVAVPNAPKALARIGAPVIVDISYYVPPSPWSHLMRPAPWIVTRL